MDQQFYLEQAMFFGSLVKGNIRDALEFQNSVVRIYYFEQAITNARLAWHFALHVQTDKG